MSKKRIGSAQEKGGKRSWPNTIANGGVAAAAAIGELYFHSSIFAIAFLASIAAAMSDTLATEVGLLSHSKPRLITNLRREVKPGTSGGVSGLGELAAILAAFGIALLGLAMDIVRDVPYTNYYAVLISIVIGAFIGTTTDSILGATFQAVNRCSVCGELTENTTHHDQITTLVRGLRFVENNTVNFVGILVAALVAVTIFALI